eukprot:3936157-Rhodomonas_salina.3
MNGSVVPGSIIRVVSTGHRIARAQAHSGALYQYQALRTTPVGDSGVLYQEEGVWRGQGFPGSSISYVSTGHIVAYA